MNKIFSPADVKAFIDFLGIYQKSNPSWAEFVAKFPLALVMKYKQLIRIWRSNGFIKPHLHEGKLTWMQIQKTPGAISGDECTFCGNDFVHGTCKGRAVYNRAGERLFRKCWEGRK